MSRILSSIVAATLASVAIGAQAQGVGNGDSPAYPQGATRAAASVPQAAFNAHQPEYVLKGDVFVRNEAYRTDSAKTRAEVRRDATAAPRARYDDVSTRA